MSEEHLEGWEGLAGGPGEEGGKRPPWTQIGQKFLAWQCWLPYLEGKG